MKEGNKKRIGCPRKPQSTIPGRKYGEAAAVNGYFVSHLAREFRKGKGSKASG